MARPSKLTGEVRLTICDGIRLGVTFEEACRRAGVAPSTGWEWRARGEGRDPRRRATTRYVLFAEAVAQVEGAAPFSEFSESVEGFAELEGFPQFPQPGEGFADVQSSEGTATAERPATSRHFQAHEAFAEPQNRCETGEAAGFSEFPESGEGFAETGFREFRDTTSRHHTRSRARA